MQISKFSDYGLRALMYLGARNGQVTKAEEVAEAFGISTNHVVKSLQALVGQGWVRSMAGRGGGYVFEGSASRIRVGEVVRQLEPNFDMAECFAPEKNSCPLVPGCLLSTALDGAKAAFLAELDRYSVEDLIATKRDGLLAIGAAA
jgi:Rrf2 family nitric oxide-sensitive transcriptional repressor